MAADARTLLDARQGRCHCGRDAWLHYTIDGRWRRVCAGRHVTMPVLAEGVTAAAVRLHAPSDPALAEWAEAVAP